MKKIIIFLLLIILLGVVGPVGYFYYAGHFKKADATCNGEKNEYYSLGFGIEHSYNGEIKPGMKVKAVLSCDHNKITISGAVKQDILSSGLEFSDGTGDMQEITELADLTAGDNVIDFNSDYNGDGFKDLTSNIFNGQGAMAIDTYIIFLFDSTQKKFVYNQALSDLKNIYMAKDEKTIKQFFNKDPYLGYTVYNYFWKPSGGVVVSKKFDCQLIDGNNNEITKVSDDLEHTDWRYKFTTDYFDFEKETQGGVYIKLKDSTIKYFPYLAEDDKQCDWEGQ